MEVNSDASVQLSNSRVLITGHTGFKGSWLAQYLFAKNVEIFGLSLAPEKDSLFTRLDNSHYAKQFLHDIRDGDRVQRTINEVKPNYVFHLAAQPLVLKSYENPIETFQTNILGTANILDAAIKSENVKRVVVATTDKVYKNFEDGRKYSESDSLEGLDPYSASKVGTEAAIKAWQTITSADKSVSICAVRAGNVIGGGDFAPQRLLPDIIRSYMSESAIKVRNPRSTRPWQHVLDPLAGYLKVAEINNHSNNMDSFNFGPRDESLSVGQVCQIASQHLGLNVEISDTGKNVNHEASLLDLDSTKARQLLNWENCWSQTSAVIETLNWWKSVLSGELSASEACQRDIGYLETASVTLK
jgi:CDP-glucose 4,6-dehydratase